MKKYSLLFLSPLLVVICTLLLWLISSGVLILPIWLIKDLFIPILHFLIISHYIKRNIFPRKGIIVLSVILLIVTAIIGSVLFESVWLNSRLVVPHIVFKIIWMVLCGIFIVGHVAILRRCQGNICFKIIVICEAVAALTINALMSYLVSPVLASAFAIDAIQLILIPISFIILSAYSYLLGNTVIKHYSIAKLSVWLLGILMSEFVALWLLGTPHTPPTENGTVLFIWLAVSVIAFVFSIIGVAMYNHQKCHTFIETYKDKNSVN